ncbi:MAG: DUF5684 domain-containing protein [Erysipelotrichaceae bacterium]
MNDILVQYAGLGLGILLVALVMYLLFIIGNWKIFHKAGEAGWKSLIPIYNLYILFKIARIPNWFFLSILFSVLGAVGKVMAIDILGMFALVGVIIVSIKISANIAKVFGKGVLFTMGLLFFPYIFYIVLGFGKAEYR